MLRMQQAAAGMMLAAFAITWVACSETTAEIPTVVVDVPDDPWPSRQQLFERFFETRQLLVVYGASDSLSEAAYRQMAQRSPGRWRTLPDMKRADEVADLAAGSVMVIGTATSNAHLARLAGKLPVSFDAAGFSFAGTRYDDPTDVLTLVFPNPDNPEFPLFLVAGNRDAEVAAQGQGLIRMYDYQIVRDGKRIRLGHFSQQPGRRWSLDPEQDFDLLHGTEAVAEAGPLRMRAASNTLSPARLAALKAGREAFLEKLETLLGVKDLPAIDYHLYSSIQQKALVTDNMQLAHADPTSGEVHVAMQEDIELAGDALGMEAAVVLERTLGRPAHRALLDGIRIALAGTWYGQDPHGWAGRIARAGLAPSLDVLLDDARYAEYPSFLREPVAAELAALLLEAGDGWRASYAAGIPADRRPALAAALTQRLEAAGEAAQNTPAVPRTYPAMFKGFNFAHEGFGIVNGYGSRSAVEALAYIQRMGANAVSIIPYSFVNDPNVPMDLPIPESAGSENDASVIHAALQAKRLGMHVSIKPQIWVRGGWPGDIEMATEADWEAFFQHYERWIGHYAVMAELFGLDMLCVGTELSKTTLTHPDRWRTMTGEWRRLFSGPLVYASNWGEEFENLAFWDAFDYIAVNSYYPLSSEDAPSDRALRKGAEAAVARLEKVHRRYNMPILITEIGFPSTSMPWKSPWLENRESGVNLADQARCYEAICRALDDQSWLRGIYWWKWPSYLDRGGADQRGFTPNGKPAADVVTQWYGAWE